MKERIETMELMQLFIGQLQKTPPGQERNWILERIKDLGRMSQSLQKEIEETSIIGVPKKLIKHYEIMNKFEKLCQQK